LEDFVLFPTVHHIQLWSINKWPGSQLGIFREDNTNGVITIFAG